LRLPKCCKVGARRCFNVSSPDLVSGPDPHAALVLIDRLDLYNTIFTNPKGDQHSRVGTKDWRLAYDSLQDLAKVDWKENERSPHLHTIAAVLLRNPEDLYLAWAMSCFVPWARADPHALGSKRPTTLAAIAAREGIKADNKLVKIINDAVLELGHVIKVKDSGIPETTSSTSPLKRKDQSSIREFLGKAVRHWGPRWRSIVIYALLVQLGEAKHEFGKSTVN
jgi:tRNA nucleotidyltransferase (CCA-adding enzyme)